MAVAVRYSDQAGADLAARPRGDPGRGREAGKATRTSAARPSDSARYSGEYVEIGEQAVDSIVVRSPSGGITFTILEQDQARKPGQVEGFISRTAGRECSTWPSSSMMSSPPSTNTVPKGVNFLRTPGAYYDALARRLPGIADEVAALRAADVLADRDEWGYLLQLFTSSPHPRNTLFYELIQRRGARGFGLRISKALYEAVERDETGINR